MGSDCATALLTWVHRQQHQLGGLTAAAIAERACRYLTSTVTASDVAWHLGLQGWQARWEQGVPEGDLCWYPRQDHLPPPQAYRPLVTATLRRCGQLLAAGGTYADVADTMRVNPQALAAHLNSRGSPMSTQAKLLLGGHIPQPTGPTAAQGT